HGHLGMVEMGAVIEAEDSEMERIAIVDAILDRSRIPAMDVEVAVEPAVGSRVADQNDGTVAALAVKDAIPAAGEWRREIDRGEMFGPWPGAERVHGAPGDPDAHADGQDDPSRPLAFHGFSDEIRGQSKDQAVDQDADEEEEAYAAQPNRADEKRE